MSYLIKNGQVFQDRQLAKKDILITNGVIEKIEPDLDVDAEVINATGKVVIPGLIDVHVHFRDPGQTAKESVKTGSKAAAHGGFTTVCAMPNVAPVPNTPALLTKMIDHNRDEGKVDVKQYSPVTYDEKGKTLVDFEAMKQAGAVAFSNDGIGIQTAKTMYDAMLGIAHTGLPLAAHVEDHALMDGGVMNEGLRAKGLGLKGAPQIAETSQLARDLELAKATGVHYHVCHVSTARSVELIRRAKKDGINVTAEVSPHHLLLDESMITNDNPMFKMNPPLRTKEDRDALLDGLLDGTIDLIATDHAPHTSKDKGATFKTSAFGITGLETSFPLLYTELVRPGEVTLQQLLKWMSVKPAEVFHLPQPEIKVGSKANLSVWDLQNQHTVSAGKMLSKGKNSPFIGKNVYAENELTFVDGKIVYQAQKN